jgi:hypothetical protein
MSLFSFSQSLKLIIMTNKQVAQTWLATLVAIFSTAFFGAVMDISTEVANTFLGIISLGVQIWGITRLWKAKD